MDVPAPTPPRYSLYESAEHSWRRTAVLTGALAAIELVALVVVALAFVAKPFADGAAERATAHEPPAAAVVPRAQTPVLILNGNGVGGAASAVAKRVHKLAYPVAGVDDASRHDFPHTLVMYRDGERPAAVRLAQDLGLPARRAVPLDGLRPSELAGAKLVLVLGRRA